jgi:hypothetical protein
MRHRFAAIVMGAGLAVGLGVTSASAAPPETNTTIIKDLVETFVDVVPTCEGGGALYTVTTTTNIVEHETVFDDGRVHATFTQTGTFVATHPTLPDFTGKLTIWGGFNQNAKTVNGTFTFNIRGTGDDGSRFKQNSVDHFNERPNGSVQEFFHCHN